MVANNIKYLFMVIRKNIKNGMALKTDFLITVMGMFINNIAFIVIWISFTKTAGIINGWGSNDIFGLYAFTFISYGIVQGFLGGIDSIPALVSTGGLDRFLYTPKNKILKVVTSNFRVSAMGDILCGVACLVIYLANIKLNVIVILVSILMLVLACLVHFAFFLFSTSLSFYFMDGKDLSKIIADLFVLPTTYNAGIIQGLLRIIYIYFIPALLAGGLAVELLKNITIEKILFIVTIAVLWFIFSIVFFYISLRKYESSNFMTFGQYE